jgi:predicted ATPase
VAQSWLRPLPIRAIRERDSDRLSRSAWPATLPAVRQLLDEGLEPGRLTILVGENGSGKSTIIEGIALAYGLSAEGGSTGARHTTRALESGLDAALQLTRGVGASRWGYFPRAETTLVGRLLELASDPKSQVIMATHSPVLAATPGADLLQLDDDGLHETTWADLAVVDHYRRFLAEPQRYLRHLD